MSTLVSNYVHNAFTISLEIQKTKQYPETLLSQCNSKILNLDYCR